MTDQTATQATELDSLRREVAVDYADRLIDAMDRAKRGHR